MKKRYLVNLMVSMVSLFLLCASAYMCSVTYASGISLSETVATMFERSEGNSVREGKEIPQQKAVIQLLEKNGQFVCTNPVFPLDSDADAQSVTIELPKGEYIVSYDKNSGYLKVHFAETNVVFVQKAASTAEEPLHTAMYTLCKNDNTKCLVGVWTYGNTTVTAICETQDENGEIRSFIEQSLAQASMWNRQMDISICDLPLNGEWFANSNLQIIDSILHGENEGVVNISLYSSDTASNVFIKQLPITDTVSFSYGDFFDQDSGLQPFFCELREGEYMKITTTNETLERALLP